MTCCDALNYPAPAASVLGGGGSCRGGLEGRVRRGSSTQAGRSLASWQRVVVVVRRRRLRLVCAGRPMPWARCARGPLSVSASLSVNDVVLGSSASALPRCQRRQADRGTDGRTDRRESEEPEVMLLLPLSLTSAHPPTETFDRRRLQRIPRQRFVLERRSNQSQSPGIVTPLRSSRRALACKIAQGEVADFSSSATIALAVPLPLTTVLSRLLRRCSDLRKT